MLEDFIYEIEYYSEQSLSIISDIEEIESNLRILNLKIKKSNYDNFIYEYLKSVLDLKYKELDLIVCLSEKYIDNKVGDISEK